MTHPDGSSSARSRSPRGFSLLELIVVIGIVAVLVALLLPALGAAREHANRVRCLATLREMERAAELHALEHRGYMPTAGLQWDPVGGVVDPKGLGDEDRRRYVYYLDGATFRPAPITAVLGHYLGAPVRFDSRVTMEEDLGRESLRRHFRCPSQSEELTGWTQGAIGSDPWRAPDEFSSYCFNEALLGRRGSARAGGTASPAGLVSRVRRPSVVMFAMDGRPRNQAGDRWLLLFDRSDEDSVADFNHSVAEANLGVEALDYGRHGWRANVVFLDGHAETIGMGEASLKQVGVSAGIYR